MSKFLENFFERTYDSTRNGNVSVLFCHTAGRKGLCSVGFNYADKMLPNARKLYVPAPANTFQNPYSGIIEVINSLAYFEKLDLVSFIRSWDGFESIKDPIIARFSRNRIERLEETLKEELYYEVREIERLLQALLIELTSKQPYVICIDHLEHLPPSAWRCLERFKWGTTNAQLAIICTIDKHYQFDTQYQSDLWRDFLINIDQDYGIDNFTDEAFPRAFNRDFTEIKINQVAYNHLAQLSAECISLCAPDDAYIYAKTLIGDEHFDRFDARDRFQTFNACGDALMFKDDMYSAMLTYELALDIAQTIQIDEMIAEAYRRLYVVTANIHELDATIDFATKSIKFAMRTNDDQCIVDSYFFLTHWGEYFASLFKDDMYSKLLTLLKKQGRLNYFGAAARKSHFFMDNSDNYTATKKQCEESIEAYNLIGNKHGLAAALHELSVCYVHTNHFEKATQLLDPSLQIREELQDPLEIIKSGNGLGYIYMISGQLHLSHQSLMSAFAQLSLVRNWAEVGGTIFNIGMLYFNSKQYENSAKLLEAVVEIMHILNANAIIFHTRLKVYSLLSICYFKLNEVANGSRMLNQAERANRVPLDINESDFFLNIARGLSALANNKHETGIAHFEEAQNWLDPDLFVDQRLSTSLLAEFGIAHLKNKSLTKADEYFQQGAALAEKFNYSALQHWFQNAETDYDEPILTLPEFDISLHPLIQLARHESDLRALQRRNMEFNFRSKIDQLIHNVNTTEELATQFSKIVHANFNVTSVAFFICQSEQERSLLTEYSSDEGSIDWDKIIKETNAEQSMVITPNDRQYNSISPFCSALIIPLHSQRLSEYIVFVAGSTREEPLLGRNELSIIQQASIQVLTAVERIDQEIAILEKNRLLEETYKDLESKHQESLTLQSQLAHSEKMSGLGTLVAGVAHEINNPVNFVSQGTENMIMDITLFSGQIRELLSTEDESINTFFNDWLSKLQDHADVISEGASRIVDIIADLRNFSRLDQAERSVYDVASGIESTLRLIRTQYHDKLILETEIRDRPVISCYPSQLNQVYMNLLTNACFAVIDKKSKSGEYHGVVKVVVYTKDDRVILEFVDNGVGVPKDILDRIFDPFFTTKAVGQGTGLGLSVTYSIIEQHGGHISVTSEQGVGTTITVSLPRTKPNDDQDEITTVDSP